MRLAKASLGPGPIYKVTRPEITARGYLGARKRENSFWGRFLYNISGLNDHQLIHRIHGNDFDVPLLGLPSASMDNSRPLISIHPGGLPHEVNH